ncbi:DUF4190 domain-containing protein [Nocardioides litoris]|uniref:DUF4190 domain-containing protein n=1 Tax=Nocardioides litoris TaxID=1926648 RepID=UPI00111EC68C|nr:DUF4190 domain-containing protein [Nocardioides litoris]
MTSERAPEPVDDLPWELQGVAEELAAEEEAEQRDAVAREHEPVSTNGLAIASLVVGLCGGSIIAVVLGHVALGQIKRHPRQQGRGMAIAGMVLGWLPIVVVVVFLFAAAILSEAQGT